MDLTELLREKGILQEDNEISLCANVSHSMYQVVKTTTSNRLSTVKNSIAYMKFIKQMQ